jgi:transposase
MVLPDTPPCGDANVDPNAAVSADVGDTALGAENEFLRGQIADLQAENAALEARIAELERRLDLNSNNSNKPPSSDGLKKPNRTKSLRGKSKHPSGGQNGHPGHTLESSPTPDIIIHHYPQHCAQCGEPLPEDEKTPYRARQVHDLPPPPPPEVTEHRAHRCACPSCGAETTAAFPSGVSAPVQYGPQLSACVVYLRNQHFLPEDRLSELMKDLFNTPVSPASIGQMTSRAAKALEPVVACIREQIAQAPVKHLDETGCRIKKSLHWVHVASTKDLTHYRIGKRGDVPTDMTGIVVHDHWKPYRAMQNVHHALCNAHHLRECLALVDIEKEDWARQMTMLLRRACHAANLARDREKPLNPKLIGLIERRYDRIIKMGRAFHEALPPLARKPTKQNGRIRKPRGKLPRRPGHNLVARLDEHKEEALRFLTNQDVPFTNNQAEQDVRMIKVREKVSGGSRSIEGAQNFAIIRSAISTAKKKGLNVLQTIKQDAKNLINWLLPQTA